MGGRLVLWAGGGYWGRRWVQWAGGGYWGRRWVLEYSEREVEKIGLHHLCSFFPSFLTLPTHTIPPCMIFHIHYLQGLERGAIYIYILHSQFPDGSKLLLFEHSLLCNWCAFVLRALTLV